MPSGSGVSVERVSELVIVIAPTNLPPAMGLRQQWVSMVCKRFLMASEMVGCLARTVTRYRCCPGSHSRRIIAPTAMGAPSALSVPVVADRDSRRGQAKDKECQTTREEEG